MLPFPVPAQVPTAAAGARREPVAGAVPALAWEDLPPHRRLSLVWCLAATRQPRPLRQGDTPCPVGVLGRHLYPRDPVAVRGSDGRFHLVERDAESPCRLAAHRQRCGWASDGRAYRVQPPPRPPSDGPAWAYDSVEVRWDVALTDDVRAPHLVEAKERCPVLAEFWPRPTGPDALGRIRLELVERLGPLCAACGSCLAVHVDHDGVSGLVRGYLCRDCNAQVDACLHVAGCRFAEYLDRPPALAMALRYPRPPDRERLARARALVADSPDLLALLDAATAGGRRERPTRPSAPQRTRP